MGTACYVEIGLKRATREGTDLQIWASGAQVSQRGKRLPVLCQLTSVLKAEGSVRNIIFDRSEHPVFAP